MEVLKRFKSFIDNTVVQALSIVKEVDSQNYKIQFIFLCDKG